MVTFSFIVFFYEYIVYIRINATNKTNLPLFGYDVESTKAEASICRSVHCGSNFEATICNKHKTKKLRVIVSVYCHDGYWYHSVAIL